MYVISWRCVKDECVVSKKVNQHKEKKELPIMGKELRNYLLLKVLRKLASLSVK